MIESNLFVFFYILSAIFASSAENYFSLLLSSPLGERIEVRGITFLLFHGFLNYFIHSINISQYFQITKSYYFHTELVQLFCSELISLSTLVFIMLSPISFNAKSIFRTIEIQYIFANRKLPPEFYSPLTLALSPQGRGDF